MAGKNGGVRPGSGRPPGSVNSINKGLRDRIEKADPIGFLINAMDGKPINGEVLKAKERADVAEFLAKKIVPELRSIEYKGENGGNILIKMINYGDMNVKDARNTTSLSLESKGLPS